jgi:hypothetical protein
MMEKFKDLLRSKAKEGKFVSNGQDMQARLETLAGLEDVASEALTHKLKGIKEKSYSSSGYADKKLPEHEYKPESMKIGTSEEESAHDKNNVPDEVQSLDESPEHEDSESAEQEVAENKSESDLAKKNKDRKQYVK